LQGQKKPTYKARQKDSVVRQAAIATKDTLGLLALTKNFSENWVLARDNQGKKEYLDNLLV